MNTTNQNFELPPTEATPSPQNGHSVGGLEGSRGIELNARQAQENAKLAQENARLMQERDLLRTLIDNLPERIFVKDRQSRFLINNLAHVRALGATRPDEVMGKTDLDIFPAELANQYSEDEQALMKSGQPLNRNEMAVDPRTGETRWLQTTKVPLLDKQGVVVGLMGISRDITEHKQAEESLANERAFLHTLMDNLPVAFYLKDLAGRKTLVNRAELDFVGAASELEILGKTDFDLFPPEKAAVYHANDQEIIRTGQPLINCEGSFTKPDGSVIFTMGSIVPVRDASGRVTGVAGITLDISDRKRAEEALRVNEERLLKRGDELSQERLLLRTLIDSLPDAIYAKDTTGRKTMANPADLKNLGCKTEAEVIGKTDFNFFPPDIAEKFQADDHEGNSGASRSLTREEYFFDEPAEKCWLLTSKLPLRDQNGYHHRPGGHRPGYYGSANRRKMRCGASEKKIAPIHRATGTQQSRVAGFCLRGLA